MSTNLLELQRTRTWIVNQSFDWYPLKNIDRILVESFLNDVLELQINFDNFLHRYLKGAQYEPVKLVELLLDQFKKLLFE